MRYALFSLVALAATSSAAQALIPPLPSVPVVTPATGTVVFGTVVSGGAPFSVNVTVTNLDSNLISLAVGPLPLGAMNIVVSPLTAQPSPAVFNVSGRVAYQPYGAVVILPVTASTDMGTSAPGSIALTLVPEPASMAFVAAGSWLLLRRRREAN